MEIFSKFDLTVWCLHASGVCLGMQCAVIDFARSVLGYKDANSTEFDSDTKYPVVSIVGPSRDCLDCKSLHECHIFPTVLHCYLRQGAAGTKLRTPLLMIQSCRLSSLLSLE